MHGDEPAKEVTSVDDLPEFDEAFLKILIGCGEASYGFNNYWGIDWEKFYESLEMYGWDMQDLGGSADNKIKRVVRKMVIEGEIS